MAVWSKDRIKALRKRYDESQSKFCRRLGVSVAALQFWEQGRGDTNGPVEIILGILEEDADNGRVRDIPDSARQPVPS